MTTADSTKKPNGAWHQNRSDEAGVLRAAMKTSNQSRSLAEIVQIIYSQSMSWIGNRTIRVQQLNVVCERKEKWNHRCQIKFLGSNVAVPIDHSNPVPHQFGSFVQSIWIRLFGNDHTHWKMTPPNIKMNLQVNKKKQMVKLHEVFCFSLGFGVFWAQLRLGCYVNVDEGEKMTETTANVWINKRQRWENRPWWNHRISGQKWWEKTISKRHQYNGSSTEWHPFVIPTFISYII